MTPCTLNTTDGSQACRVGFDRSADAKSAIANMGQMAGVTGAAAEPESNPADTTTADAPEATNTGVIVGAVVALVVVVGCVAAFVAFKARRDRSLEDDDFSSMNMALEELSPEAMGEI